MNEPRLVTSFCDSLDFGMVDLCIAGVNCDLSLLWANRHFAQGFAWRDNLVGFSALDAHGPIMVHVWVAEAAVFRPDTVRAVRGPFTIPPDGHIQVACGWNVPEFPPAYPIPAGDYALSFATGYEPSLESEGNRLAFIHGFWCDLSFVPDDAAEPAILIADEGLAPAYPLLMDCE
jgi:hypothetical protein